MKVLLVNNRFKETTEIMARDMAKILRNRNIEVDIDNGSLQSPIKDMDIIIVLGGDGTILRAARQYSCQSIPILGVNMGTVGFLSNIEVNETDEYLDHLIEGNYAVNERMMLEISLFRQESLIKRVYALNEVVVKSHTSRMVNFNMGIDKQAVAAYKGDGLIVSTPTGTTAYSLSSGGPVADPDMDAIIVTPIASHIISRRPLVISADKTVNFTGLQPEEAVVYVDGQVKIDFVQNDKIMIKKADHKLKLVDLKGVSFFSTIDAKLRRS